ncbi:hypothetical protein AB1N83_005558 [Pleurotus pulmonarius]
MRQDLPVELIQHIISFLSDNIEGEEGLEELDPGRTADLAACALVCRSWRDISQSCIYRTIAINEHSWDSRFSFLHFTAPHLCKYTRELRLSWNKGCLTPEWFAECLARFTNLLVLRLENRDLRVRQPPLTPLLGIGSLLNNIPLKRLHLREWCSCDDAYDIFHILSMCSASLEEFSLEVFLTSDRAQPLDQDLPVLPPVVLLPALRKIVLLGEIPDISQATGTRIEIPDLETLTIEMEGHEPWSLAGWNLNHISQLKLTVSCEGAIPNLGPSIRPTNLTINVSKRQSRLPYILVVAWVEGCISRLPFPGDLRQLTIKIALRHIDLHITVTVQGGADMPQSFSMESEIKTLKEVFAPLLGTGVLSVRLVLERLVYSDSVWESKLIVQADA